MNLTDLEQSFLISLINLCEDGTIDRAECGINLDELKIKIQPLTGRVRLIASDYLCEPIMDAILNEDKVTVEIQDDYPCSDSVNLVQIEINNKPLRDTDGHKVTQSLFRHDITTHLRSLLC